MPRAQSLVKSHPSGEGLHMLLSVPVLPVTKPVSSVGDVAGLGVVVPPFVVIHQTGMVVIHMPVIPESLTVVEILPVVKHLLPPLLVPDLLSPLVSFVVVHHLGVEVDDRLVELFVSLIVPNSELMVLNSMLVVLDSVSEPSVPVVVVVVVTPVVAESLMVAELVDFGSLMSSVVEGDSLVLVGEPSVLVGQFLIPLHHNDVEPMSSVLQVSGSPSQIVVLVGPVSVISVDVLVEVPVVTSMVLAVLLLDLVGVLLHESIVFVEHLDVVLDPLSVGSDLLDVVLVVLEVPGGELGVLFAVFASPPRDLEISMIKLPVLLLLSEVVGEPAEVMFPVVHVVIIPALVEEVESSVSLVENNLSLSSSLLLRPSGWSSSLLL